jgi:hypothetical protein
VAGAGTLLRGSHNRPSGPPAITHRRNERRADKIFAVLAACGMVALVVVQAGTTDWQVRTLPAGRVQIVAAEHKHARFEVFEYLDGSRKLWISDLRTPDFIAPANESTLGELTRQGIPYQTYVAGRAGLAGPGRFTSALWILALLAGASSLFWWAVKSRLVAPSSLQREGTI